MAEVVDLTGAAVQPLRSDYKNHVPYTFSLKDEDGGDINVAGTSFAFKIFRDKQYAELVEMPGTIAVDNKTVEFEEFLELPVNEYYYRIDWTVNNKVYTIQKGPFSIE